VAAKQRAGAVVQENQDVMMMKKLKKLKVKLEHLGNQGTYLN